MRRLAALLMLCLLAAARPAAADLVYVLNSTDATISILDAFTRQEVRRIPALREVHHLVLSPDGRDLLIADSGGNEIFFVDPATGDVRRRERISNPYHLDFSPDGRHLVIASLRRNQVDIYDANGPTLLARLRMPEKPSHMAFSPDARVVYVTLQGSGTVAAISLETRQPLWEAPVGREPAGIIWHRGRLIVGIMGSENFVVLNPQTQQIERTIPVGRGAHTIFPAPDGRALWATSRVQSRLAEIDPDTLEVRRLIELPGGPDCIAFDPDGRIWATLRWAGRIARVDPRSGEFETIRVGRSPHGIFVHPRRAERN
ncbi:YncE family protein [Roseomonas alkaliterrae]|uniref:DNA-binding beta-propeller fold protein YncE n=1 Tax=Neoroseomonas alkaliterrae TaxID=1452450 RepID=A0A840XP61_9PROT|nr:YncE family protein [Neoroseomonas alkaliterrae]MBB5690345.1 DNA-binding beta-propeller fold protein YncE [Neoroseomonas alkaliterrae]MBR0675956.1 YncE family protein [Neoroseomonas alkaliterrae]